MQEHAEGPRSNRLRECVHCGAKISVSEKVCPKCNAAQPDHPSGTGKAD
jgi:predicted amidophosphoribosyltransferase